MDDPARLEHCATTSAAGHPTEVSLPYRRGSGGGHPGRMALACRKRQTQLWCILPRDVRILTVCRLMQTTKSETLAGEQKAEASASTRTGYRKKMQTLPGRWSRGHAKRVATVP